MFIYICIQTKKRSKQQSRGCTATVKVLMGEYTQAYQYSLGHWLGCVGRAPRVCWSGGGAVFVSTICVLRTRRRCQRQHGTVPSWANTHSKTLHWCSHAPSHARRTCFCTPCAFRYFSKSQQETCIVWKPSTLSAEESPWFP